VDSLQELVLVGLSHRTAPVAVRERYSVRPEDLCECLTQLVSGDGLSEAALVSTCNRTEALVVAQNADPVPAIRRRLFRNLDDEHLYVFRGVHAVMHLFRVTAGLDSLVLGESEILAQTKRAFDTARTAGSLGKALGPLVERALKVGKRVRTETELGQGTLSIARVAVDIAGRVFGSLDDNRALVVGAGETGLLVARHLAAEGMGRIDFANRTRSRAEDAAREFGGLAHGLEDLAAAAAQVNVLVVCVDGAPGLVDGPALDPRRLKRRDHPLLAIDLSVPRAVAPEVSGMDGVLLYNLDDLEPVVEHNRRARGEAGAASADILVSEVHKFLSLRTYAAFSPAIAELRQRFGQVREQVLDNITSGKATARELELAHELGKRLQDLALEQMKAGARRSSSAEALTREYDRFLGEL
jgi:glutamyl-tRNA reductase